MSAYLGVGIVASAVGMAIGGAAIHAFDHLDLTDEQTAHARDNATNAQKLATISSRAADAAVEAILAHNAASDRIATLDQQYYLERSIHEKDNAKNRAAIAAGVRRLRIAIANTDRSRATDTSAAAGGMGDGARRYAELPPEVGKTLFRIIDDADCDARAKVEYLQSYIRALQAQGLIAGASSG